MNNEDRFPIVAVIHMDKFSIIQIIVGCLCVAYGVIAWFVAGELIIGLLLGPLKKKDSE